MPSPFIQEFTKNLAETLQSAYVIRRIDEATSMGDGHLSRLFDEVPISKTTEAESYNHASNSQIEKHMREVAKEGATALFNSGMTDLSDDAKKSLGETNYKKLVAVCGGDKNKMVDVLLQAIVVSYSQVVTNGFDQSSKSLPYTQQLDKKQEYNVRIMAPMERYVGQINKADLTKDESIDISYATVLEKAQTLHAQLEASRVTLETYYKELDKTPKADPDEETIRQENLEHMNRALKVLQKQVDSLDAQVERLREGQDAAVRPALTAIVSACEIIQATVRDDIKPIKNEPHIKGIGEKILNTILYFFGGWKSEATQKAEQREGLAATVEASIQASKIIKNQLKETVPERAPETTQPEDVELADFRNSSSPKNG